MEIDKIDSPNTHLHDDSLSWLCTGTSIKSGGIKLGLWDIIQIIIFIYITIVWL